MARAMPIVLLGRMGEMGRIVSNQLLPDVEVIHFIASPEKAKQDVPALLGGKTPPNASDDGIGSQDYTRKPQAVVLGLGYYNEVVDEIRQSCHGVGTGVPWLRGGLSQDDFVKMMKDSPPMPPSQQGPLTAEKVKKKLRELVDGGKGGADGVYEWY